MRRLIFFLIFIILPLICTSSLANEKTDLDIDTILQQQHAIRSEAESGSGRYANLSKSKKAELFLSQDKLFRILDGKASASDLSPEDKIEALNSLNKISATLNNDDDRLICERVKSVGSNRIERVCKTASERDRERTNAQKSLDARRNVCGKGFSCSGS